MQQLEQDWQKRMKVTALPGLTGCEKSLALTKIEEALMWSIAAIAREPFNMADGE